MGHTRLKKKKKGWATRKAQRGGEFNPEAPKKKDMQAIDSFHDFWKMERGKFHNLNTANPLLLDTIKWLLINYCVPALGVIPSRPLLRVAPINNFNFDTYVAKRNFGDLFYESSLKSSSIEPPGRDYVKIPEAATWIKKPDRHANFRSFCQALFPDADPNILNQSTMHIVCDSGPGNFRKFGIESVDTAIEATANLRADVTEQISIAGAIAALAYAIRTINPDLIRDTMIKSANESLNKFDFIKSGTKTSKPTLEKEERDIYVHNIIGLIYIVPIIIERAGALHTAAGAAGAAAATNIIVSTAGTYVPNIRAAITAVIPAATAELPTPPGGISKYIVENLSIFPSSDKHFKDAFVNTNRVQIILSATQLIVATILEIATAPVALMAAPMAAPMAVSQIIEVITAVTTGVATPLDIGPFVKEISTPQRTADSARANPKPSTILGDVYPIIFEFVAQEQQVVRVFPEPVPAAPLPPANRFYSDSNLFTHGKYEIRYEKHNWSPVTGLGFKFVIGDIQQAPPATPAEAAARRYEIEFGMKVLAGGVKESFITMGPSAALLSACCLDRVLYPNPEALPVTQAALTAAIAPAIAPAASVAARDAARAALVPLMSYDNINKSINSLLNGPPRTAIKNMIRQPLQTVGDSNSFADKITMFHPYLHFKGNTLGPADQFHQLPPELWFDIKRGGDRDQVMAAYQLSLLRNLNGDLKYPYLVFLTGDLLCATIAVKKGLATIFQPATDLRYWPKGIVYGEPADIPGAFTQQIKKVVQPWQMYNQEPNVAPGGPQYSIKSWGGNQMKGGDFTMTTYDNIEDGYGKKYNIQQLHDLLLPLQPQLLYNLIGQQQIQQEYQQQLQQRQQEFQDNQAQFKQAIEELLPELELRQHQLQLQLQQQLQPEQLQQLQQQLQQRQLKELDSDQLELLQNYAFIHNTEENLQKLLLMNFGSGVEIGKILFAMAALPDYPIVCTRDKLFAGLNESNIINKANGQNISTINGIVEHVQNNPINAGAAVGMVRAVVTQAAQAPAQAAQAPVQDVPQWVNDMFVILSFTAIPNRTEHNPLILIQNPLALPSPDEKEDIQFSVSNFRAEFVRASSYTLQDAAAQAPAQAAQATQAEEQAEVLAAQKASLKPYVRVGTKRGLQEGGQQLDSIDNLVKKSIFEYINEEYRGNKMDNTPDNPISKYIDKIWKIYGSFFTLAPIISYYNTSCSTMLLNNMNSTPTQPEDDMEPVAETPAPVANATPTQPEVDVEPVAETPAPVAPVALNTKPKPKATEPKPFTLQPAQPQTGRKGFHTIFNNKPLFARLQMTKPPTANTPKAKDNYVLLSERPKQPQTVSATTGAVATSASTGRGGKRRTHRKCHTKKTRRTQKNHKRKRHGTQRKRSQRQRV